MGKIRFGLVAMIVSVLGIGVAGADTFQFYIVDRCSGNAGVTYPSNTHIQDFCAGRADECSEGSSTLWTLINDANYRDRCLRTKLWYKYWDSDSGKYKTEAVSSDYYVICFNKSAAPRNNISLCDNVKECASDYYGISQSHKIVIDLGGHSPLVNEILTGYTDNFDCCHRYTGLNAWAAYVTGCESARAQSCNLLGDLTIEGDKYYRCTTGYYATKPENATLSAYGATKSIHNCSTGAAGLGCTVCPPAGQGLTTTSNPGSLDITSCYIPAGTYSDEFGTFTYSENCHYAN